MRGVHRRCSSAAAALNLRMANDLFIGKQTKREIPQQTESVLDACIESVHMIL